MMCNRKGSITLIECAVVVMIVSLVAAVAIPGIMQAKRKQDLAAMMSQTASAPAYTPPAQTEQEMPVRRGKAAQPVAAQPTPQPELTTQWSDATVSGAAVNADNSNAVITWFGKGKVKLGFRSDGVLVWRQVP